MGGPDIPPHPIEKANIWLRDYSKVYMINVEHMIYAITRCNEKVCTTHDNNNLDLCNLQNVNTAVNSGITILY